MARKADRARELFWRELVERRKRTNCTVADLCESAGVSTASFFLWQRKLRERDASSAAPGLVGSPALVPVRIVDDRQLDDVAMIESPDGLRIHIRSGCDAATIGHLLTAVRGER